MSGPTARAGQLSLRSRAALAVALTVAFYLLAIGVGVGLIAVPIAVWAATGRGNIWVTAAMVGAGAAVLRAIVPERPRFAPPGPELRRDEQPRLMSLLDDVAAKAGEKPADAVYLDLPVNASVLEHRRRRIMLLGLPLLATLGADELRAVVAHEYGHYTGGDTRFMNWIWRTRVAALKTVQRLAESESWFRRSLVRWPFQWYALLFLRITNAVGRRAEFAADELSARVASPAAAGRALRRVEAVAPAFDSYWSSDVAPLLENERRPPIASGFAALTANADLAPALDDIVRSDVEVREPDPYASHPTLRQRLEALGVPVDATAPEPTDEPASALLENLPELEAELLKQRFGDDVAAFRPVDWSEAATIHAHRLQELAERFGSVFPTELTIGSAANAAQDLPVYRDSVRSLLEPVDRDAPGDALDAFLLNVLSSLVVTAAVRSGATVTAPPGEPIRIRHAGGALDPWHELGAIAAGQAEPSTWTRHSVVQALSEVPLRAEA